MNILRENKYIVTKIYLCFAGERWEKLGSVKVLSQGVRKKKEMHNNLPTKITH